MTIFDLLFIAVVLASVVTLAVAIVFGLLRRRQRAVSLSSGLEQGLRSISGR